MKKIILIIALILSYTDLYAQNSITLQGGWQHTPNSNYGDGGEFDARIETPLIDALNIGIEGAYHGQTSHYGYGALSGYSILGELIYSLPKYKQFEPYLLAGAGWSWWDFNRNKDMIARDIVINTGDSFCEKFGIGTDYPISHDWYLNIEFNYFRSDVPKDSHYGSTGEFANVVGGKTVGQEETNLMFGIKKKF